MASACGYPLRGGRFSQFERAVCGSDGSRFIVAGNLHCREREFDAVGIKQRYEGAGTIGWIMAGATAGIQAITSEAAAFSPPRNRY
jgi:hypothetical protein